MDEKPKQENTNEGEPAFTVNGETAELKTKEERQAEIQAQKAVLDEKLARGEIDGVKYNQELIKLRVPEEYKPKTKKRIIVVMAILSLVAVLGVLASVAITLNWHYYFQNTLDTTNLPDYSEDYGFDMENPPVQIKVDNQSSGQYRGRDIKMKFKYYYDISAVVTSVKDYYGFDDYATLVPRDVCLAWGNLAKTFQQNKASFHQYERACRVDVDDENVDPSEVNQFRNELGVMFDIISTYSNNHIIPSSPEIREKIWNLNVGDKVRMTGYLVRVNYNNTILDSSISREDGTNGACEVFYVTKVFKESPKKS